MKKALLLLLIIPFVAFIDTKPYKVELPLEAWQQHLNGLSYIQAQLRQSDLPSKQVAFITDSIIAPLQKDIVTQVQAQLPKDSTNKKK